MKVGDMVIRSYAYPTFTTGIIIERKVETLEFDARSADTFTYDEVSYVVAWSDGYMTSESAEELDYLNKAGYGRSIRKENEE